MYHSFAPYEQDFREWWASRTYLDVNPLTRDFLLHITRPDAPRHLWQHQEEALIRVIYASELLQWNELLLNIVTGGGKTAIIGAVVAWLKVCHDLHKFLLLCPNTIVRDRLEDDFRDAQVLRDFGFFPPGTEHYTNQLGLHVMQPGGGPAMFPCHPAARGGATAESNEAACCLERDTVLKCKSDDRDSVWSLKEKKDGQMVENGVSGGSADRDGILFRDGLQANQSNL